MVASVVLFAFPLSVKATTYKALYGNNKSCLSNGCHTNNATDAGWNNLDVAVDTNGDAKTEVYNLATAPSITVTEGVPFEIDWYFQGLHENASTQSGIFTEIPTGWTIAAGTTGSTSNLLAPWSADWVGAWWDNAANGSSWVGPKPAKNAGHEFYAIDFELGPHAGDVGSGNAYNGASPANSDGSPAFMGTDVLLTAPAGAAAAGPNYTIFVGGGGYVGSSKSHIVGTINVTVVASGDSTPPTFAGATGATDAGTGGAVDLTWAAATDPSTPITYNIYYATTSGGQNFGTPDATTTNLTGVQVTGLTDTQIYYFVVRAEDSVGNEDTNTTEYSATPTAPADSTPPTFAGLTGATDAGTGGAVDLTWAVATDPSTPITYNIYWSTTSGTQNFGAAPQATSALGTGDTVTGLTDTQIYYFVVRAEDSATNEETNTTEFSATPTAPVDNPPTLSISEPDGLTDLVNVGANYSITYTLADDISATVDFYYDVDTDMAGGTAITGACTGAGTGTDATCTWNTTGFPAGTYYVYGIADDTVNSTVSALSPGQITINGAPGIPTALAQFNSDGTTPIPSDNAGNTTVAPITTVVIEADLTDPNSGDKAIIEVDIDSDGTADCVSAAITVPGTASATCTSLADGSYDWQVRAKDLNGLYSNSGTWTPFAGNTPDITVASGLDVGIDTTAPVDGAVSGSPSDSTVVLSWAEATDAGIGLDPTNTYELKWGAPTAAVCDGGGTFTNLTSYTVTGLVNDTAYEFRVCAYDKLGNFDANGSTVTATPTIGDTTLVGDGTDPVNVTVGPSDTDIGVTGFDLAVTGGPNDTVTAITISLTNNANVTDAHLYYDDDGTVGEFGGSETWIADVTVAGATATFSGLSESISTTPTDYIVTLDIAAAPTHAQTVTAYVSAIASGNSNSTGDNPNTTITIDAAGPIISSTNPADLEPAAPLDQLVTITFSENVNNATVDTSTVTISPAVTWNKAAACVANVCTFQPSGQAGSTVYTVTVSAGSGIDDVYANTMTTDTFSYTTVGTSTIIGDGTTPPSSQTVAQGATALNVDSFTLNTSSGSDTVTEIVVTGSAAVDANVAAGSVKIFLDDGSGVYEPGTDTTQIGTSQSFSGSVATFSGLSVNVTTTSAEYFVVFDVDAAAADTAALSANVSALTNSNPVTDNDDNDAVYTVDAGAPSVTGTTPADSATGVTAGTSVVITWDENIDCASVDNTTVTIAGGGALSASPSVCATNSATFTVSGQANNQDITITVTTGVTDVVGNPMAANHVITYKTVDDTPPSSTVNAIAGTLIPSDFNYSITGTASDNATGTGVNLVEVSIDSGAWVSAVDTSGDSSWSTWSYSWANPGADGSYSVQSRATDAAGTPNQETPGGGQTADVDVTLPTLNKPASNPADGATAVTLNSDITIVWAEDITCADVTNSNISIDNGASLSATPTSCGTNTATFTVSNQTLNNTVYTVSVTNVRDLAGNTMAADSYSYTTEALPCVRLAPSLGISANQYIPESYTAVYTVTVINNDTNCVDTPQFDLTITSETLNPGGNTSYNSASLSAGFVNVAAGATNTSVTLSVPAKAGAVDDDQKIIDLTVSDGEGTITEHDGVAPFTATTTIKNFNPLVHSSMSTGSSKWPTAQSGKVVDGWGITGGKYGEFTCATCHSAQPSEFGTNVKRIRDVMASAPDAVGGDFPGAGQAVVFTDTNDGSAHFGDDDPDGGSDANRSGSNRICEMCHTDTSHHRYDQTIDYGSGVQTSWNHNNKQDCITCHQHSSGFKADGNCDSCHGYPPVPADGKTTKDGLPGDGEGKGGQARRARQSPDCAPWSHPRPRFRYI
jgi:hypothetical protein